MTGTSNDTDLLVAAAEAGDAIAQFRLAEAYREGDNRPQDFEAALQWYRAAAEQGHVNAQNNLGSMYLNGMGTPRDVEEAIRWYRAAADQGQADAELNLGIQYREGEGVPQDEVQAFDWFQRAALSGCKEAMSEVGIAYRFGSGVPQSFEEAASWHVDAAELGDIVAMGNLSDYREDLERLALDGSLTGAHYLAKMYEGGLGVEQDNALLYAWVRWGLREGKLTLDDDSRGTFRDWLWLLKQDLPADDQRRGLQSFNQLKVTRDALHRDWSIASA
jgi:uncharacterized protein